MLFQYLACLSTSSSEDKLAFDVGLEREADSKIRPVLFLFRKKISSILCFILYLNALLWHVHCNLKVT